MRQERIFLFLYFFPVWGENQNPVGNAGWGVRYDHLMQRP